jgi:hypothetical protein
LQYLGGIKESRTGLIRPLFRPEWVQDLPDTIIAEDKIKWATGLTRLWELVEQNETLRSEILTQNHFEAKRKIYEFTKTLYTRLRNEGLLVQHYGPVQQPGNIEDDSLSTAQEQIFSDHLKPDREDQDNDDLPAQARFSFPTATQGLPLAKTQMKSKANFH